MSVILRTEENFGSAYLIDILRGVRNDKILSRLHDQLPTFGLGHDLNKHQWQSIFLQIMGLDFVRPSPERHGALFLTKKALPILRGDEKVTLKFDIFETSSVIDNIAQPVFLVAEQDEPLFATLCMKRKELADSMQVPAYIVFSDKTLVEMVIKKPTNIDEMSLISGIGRKKLLKYGIVFLSLINQDGILDMHPLRKKIAGRPTAKLYDVILEVINKNARGISGLDKPLHISASIIVRISESAPKTISDLKKINGMNNRLIERFGKPLVTAVKALL